MFDIPISESWQQIRFRKYLWAIDTAVRLLSIHWLGGIPVDRTSPARVVEQVAIRIGEAGEMTMTLEGTRGKVRKWKTGLLRIARRSDNLLEVTSIDFAKAKGEPSLGRVFAARENDLTDIAFIRDKFPQVKTRNPDDY